MLACSRTQDRLWKKSWQPCRQKKLESVPTISRSKKSAPICRIRWFLHGPSRNPSNLICFASWHVWFPLYRLTPYAFSAISKLISTRTTCFVFCCRDRIWKSPEQLRFGIMIILFLALSNTTLIFTCLIVRSPLANQLQITWWEL